MACCTCCDNPGYQNINRWVILGLSLITWIFAIVTVANCSFWKVVDNTGYGYDIDFEAGLFKGDNLFTGSCAKYDTDFIGEFSTSHKVGRAFGAITAATTGLAMIGTALIIFFLEEGKGAVVVWTITRVLFVFSLLCTLATFAFINDCIDAAAIQDEDGNFADDLYCTLGPAGYIASTNFFILLGISITSCCTPVAPEPLIQLYGSSGSSNDEGYAKEPAHEEPYDVEANPVRSAGQSSVVKRTIEVTPKGKKITEEIINPDGSRVVTETLEMNQPGQ